LHGVQLRTATVKKPWLLLLLGAGLPLSPGCQKKEDVPKAAPAATAPPAVSIAPINEPEPSAAPAPGTAAAPPAAAESSAEPAAKKVVPSGSIQACCSA